MLSHAWDICVGPRGSEEEEELAERTCRQEPREELS